jgi:hypothetical protein
MKAKGQSLNGSTNGTSGALPLIAGSSTSISAMFSRNSVRHLKGSPVSSSVTLSTLPPTPNYSSALMLKAGTYGKSSAYENEYEDHDQISAYLSGYQDDCSKHQYEEPLHLIRAQNTSLQRRLNSTSSQIGAHLVTSGKSRFCLPRRA